MLAPEELDRFALRYGRWRPFLTLIGLGPRRSRLVVGRDRIEVRMGWWFTAALPLGTIVRVAPIAGRVRHIGVSAIRGVWQVNGAADHLVEIELQAVTHCSVAHVPMRLRTLRVALDDADRFIAAFGR